MAGTLPCLVCGRPFPLAASPGRRRLTCVGRCRGAWQRAGDLVRAGDRPGAIELLARLGVRPALAGRIADHLALLQGLDEAKKLVRQEATARAAAVTRPLEEWPCRDDLSDLLETLGAGDLLPRRPTTSPTAAPCSGCSGSSPPASALAG